MQCELPRSVTVTHGKTPGSSCAEVVAAHVGSVLPIFQASDIPARTPVLVGKSAVAAAR